MILNPHCGMSDGYEWYEMTSSKGWNGDQIDVKVSVKFEKPQNVKKSGCVLISLSQFSCLQSSLSFLHSYETSSYDH